MSTNGHLGDGFIGDGTTVTDYSRRPFAGVTEEPRPERRASDLAPGPVRVALVNDYELVVAGVASMLRPFDDILVVDVTTSEDGDIHVGNGQPVDIALYDTYGRVGIPWPEVMRLLDDPVVRIVALYTFDVTDELARQAMDAGVQGYLWKGATAAELAEDLRRLASGQTVVSAPQTRGQVARSNYRWPFAAEGLTARESEVLALVAEGLQNREIADALFIGTETVKSHLREVFRKLGVRTRAEATARALRNPDFFRRPRSLTAAAVRGPMHRMAPSAPGHHPDGGH